MAESGQNQYMYETGIFGIQKKKRVRENPVPAKNCWKEDCSNDPAAKFEWRDYVIREYAVAVETIKLLRSKLRDCYEKEGTNHFKNCRELAEKYKSLVEIWREAK